MKITCNFYDQFVTYIRQELTNLGFDHSTIKDQDCVISYLSWKRRRVAALKREIVTASGFQCPAGIQSGLNALDQAFISGSEIWPWQSTQIDVLPYEDGMFNEYGILHFHLGTGMRQDGFINRTGELLYAIVEYDTVYELGIYDHQSWYEYDLLVIIENNWPHLLDSVTLSPPILRQRSTARTRDEVMEMRKKRVNMMIELPSGRVIAPPGGFIALSGTSLHAVKMADVVARKLRAAEEQLPDIIRKDVKNGIMNDQDYDVKLEVTEMDIAAIAGTHRFVLYK